MKTDPDKFYMMPLIWGPLVENKDGLRYHYGEMENVAIQYQTDLTAIQPLLPDCYKPAEKPTVTIWFGDNNHVDFMADRGYRIAAVQVAARFDGEKDHLEGDYILVMFENETIPIIGGREQSGVPKVFADIFGFEPQSDGHLRCEASLWGHRLVSLDLEPMKKQNSILRFAASKIINSRKWLTYKYIPSVIGPPDVEYPMIFPSDIKVDELWMGKSGQVSFGNPDKNVFPKNWNRLLDALKSLPVRSVTQTVRFRGSSILRADLCRRLR